MLTPIKQLFGLHENLLYSWKILLPLLALWVLIYCIGGVIRARDWKRKLLFLQYGPFMCGALSVLSMILFVIISLYSPQKPGDFCSMQLDLENFITLHNENGSMVHTRDFYIPARRSYEYKSNNRRQFEDYFILPDWMPNPYLRYVNPLLTWLLGVGTVGCGLIAAVWFVVNLFTVYKATLCEREDLSPTDLKAQKELQEAINGKHDRQTNAD